jgi:neopullulanase
VPYFPDQLYHGRPGHLYPYDVRFDPDDVAHLSRNADGSLFVRVLTEPTLTDCKLVTADGEARPLELAFTGGRFKVWEAKVEAREAFRYTFALRTVDGEPVYRVPAGVSNAVERLDRWECDPAQVPMVEVPNWARGAVVYQIFPERFASGDDSLTPEDAAEWGSEPHWLEFQGGDLHGIADRADYLAGLGVGMVYVNPIFTSPSTHRYDAADFYHVDPVLGGNDGLRRLLDAMHEVGIRVVLDASFNHCHPTFFAFADVVQNGEASPYADWFVVRSYPPRVTVRTAKLDSFRDPAAYLHYLERLRTSTGLLVVEADDAGLPVEPSYEAWYGVPTLPRINLANPEARAYFLDVATFWIKEFGIDGWRMDVARYVDFDFWPEFRRAVKSVDRDAYLLAEIMGDARRWLQGDTFDATMNYTFRQLCLDFLATDRIDGPGFADGLARMYAMYAPAVAAVSQNLISSHDTARFLYESGENPDRLRLATVAQMTLPGAPGLYYGDEVGMTGGEEPASRGAFPWHDEAAWHRRQLQTVRELGGLRNAMPALREGMLRIVGASDHTIAYVRAHGRQRLLVALNRSDAETVLSVPVASTGGEVIWGAGSIQPLAGAALVRVDAADAVIVSL